jgi:hypothetical protein
MRTRILTIAVALMSIFGAQQMFAKTHKSSTHATSKKHKKNNKKSMKKAANIEAPTAHAA